MQVDHAGYLDDTAVDSFLDSSEKLMEVFFESESPLDALLGPIFEVFREASHRTIEEFVNVHHPMTAEQSVIFVVDSIAALWEILANKLAGIVPGSIGPALGYLIGGELIKEIRTHSS